MRLVSPFLAGDARLQQAADGGPSVKPLPAQEPEETICRIQSALSALSYVFFHSFRDDEPDGLFGPDTHDVVVNFQRAQFRGQPNQWDGRVGQFTLAKLDAALIYLYGGAGPPGLGVTNESPRWLASAAAKPSPPPRPKPPPKPRPKPPGAKQIVVDTDAQTLKASLGALLVYDFDCVTGDADHPTDPGAHHIFRKQHPCRSTKYNVQMNFAQFFTSDGKAIHQYHGVVPLGILRVIKKGSDWIGSHGCVRLTQNHAETLFKWTPAAGTTVKVVPIKKK